MKCLKSKNQLTFHAKNLNLINSVHIAQAYKRCMGSLVQPKNIFNSEGALIAIVPYDQAQTSRPFLLQVGFE